MNKKRKGNYYDRSKEKLFNKFLITPKFQNSKSIRKSRIESTQLALN